jgi:hypothetical protein
MTDSPTLDEQSERSESGPEDDGTDAERPDGGANQASRRPSYRPPRQEEFDWRGWLLVAVVIVSFLAVPAIILFLPYAEDFIASIGISWRQAYLTLPMIPAILLGATAIWAAVASRRSSE